MRNIARGRRNYTGWLRPGPAVAIEIAQRRGESALSGGEVPRRLEAPIPVTQKNRNVVVVGKRQVLQPVAIEVAHDHGVTSVTIKIPPGDERRSLRLRLEAGETQG